MKARDAIRLWFKRLFPWVTAVALLAYVFYTVPVAQAWAALCAANAVTVVGLLTVYFFYAYAADVLATWYTFRWFCTPLRLWDVVAIRGATYLLAIVNYNLGQGGIIYVVGRKRGAGMARATGTVLLTMGMMLVDLLVLAAAGSFLSAATDPRLRLMRWISTVGLAAFAVYLVVIVLRPRVLENRRVLRPLFDAGVVGHVKAGLIRMPHVAGHLVFQWAVLRLLGVDLPFAAAAMLLPIIFVIAWIPITVQGLGTQQVAAIQLLGPYAHTAADVGRAQIVAASITQIAVFAMLSLVVGLVCLRAAAGHQVAEAAAAPAPESQAGPV